MITRARVLYCLVFLFGLGFGVGRMRLAQYHDNSYGNDLGRKITITGRIIEEPMVGEKTTQLILAPESSDARIIIFAAHYPEYRYGDTITVTGKLLEPQNFETISGTIFDYQNYLAKDDIYYELIRPAITLNGSTSSLKAWLYNLKQHFLASLTTTLPEPQAALAGGIIIGAKQSLDQTTTDQFRTVGLSHVIVLSGYNITIVAEAVMRLLAGLPIFVGASLGAISVSLFVLMTGASSTAIRALIMALVALLGKVTGREYDSLRALGVAASLMLLLNPRLLVFDLSFQLSFLATLGVIIGPPVLKRYLTRVPERFGLRETLATTLAAQILVLPWILYKMGQLSLVALPVNVLVLPLIPLTMFLGFLAGLVGLLSYSLSLPLAWLTYLPLQYILSITQLFAALPFAAVTFSHFPLILTIIIYLCLAILYRWSRLKGTGG